MRLLLETRGYLRASLLQITEYRVIEVTKVTFGYVVTIFSCLVAI